MLPNAAEVETIRVPTSLHGHIGFAAAVAVVATGEGEKFRLLVGERDESVAECRDALCRARAVTRVAVVVPTARVVEEAEQRDHAPARARALGEHEAVAPNARPMRRAVDAAPLERKVASE